jgi:membrane-associated protease RseP (regulator of RpoE activity)
MKSMNRIQSPLIIARHASVAAAMFAFVLALAGVANASPTYPAHAHKAKKGHLTITAPMEVGGAILKPGEYEVREAKSPNGPVIEFARQFRDELASELVQADQEEIVARVPFTEQALSSPPKQTQLMLASSSANASGLQIRGNAVDYEFDQSALSAAPNAKPGAMAGATQDATVNCTNVGQQN